MSKKLTSLHLFWEGTYLWVQSAKHRFKKSRKEFLNLKMGTAFLCEYSPLEWKEVLQQCPISTVAAVLLFSTYAWRNITLSMSVFTRIRVIGIEFSPLSAIFWKWQKILKTSYLTISSTRKLIIFHKISFYTIRLNEGSK